MPRYKLGTFGTDYPYIIDTTSHRVFAYGIGFDYSRVPWQEHRTQYSKKDAQAVVDMLNERSSVL